jgi:hypothetical protein
MQSQHQTKMHFPTFYDMQSFLHYICGQSNVHNRSIAIVTVKCPARASFNSDL